MGRRSRLYDIDPAEMQQVLDEASGWRNALQTLGVGGASGINTLRRIVKERGLSTSRLETNRNRALIQPRSKKPLSEILIENSSYNNGVHIKARLLEEGLLEYECAECYVSTWNGKELPLQLDHINGDHSDNRLENLRLLCPNCHSQTKTFGRKKRIE